MLPALSALLKETADLFATHACDTARFDAEILLAHVLGIERMALFTRQIPPTSAELETYEALKVRYMHAEPVAYITGSQPFWNHDFLVNKHVLIPRQDTETLVEVVLGDFPDEGHILDLGTGTGCILLSILDERPLMAGVGVDISPEALDVAKLNAQKLGLAGRTVFKVSDWFSGLTQADGPFTAIVANPPYIPSEDIAILMAGVRDHEPVLALDGGEDGLEPYRIIAEMAPKYLMQNGMLAVEVGVLQANDVFDLFIHFGFEDVKVWRDFPGVERIVSGKKSHI